MTEHHHPKYGLVTLENEYWAPVDTGLQFEGAPVTCSLTQIPLDTDTKTVCARLDLLADVIENIDAYAAKTRAALTEDLAASDKFAPWVKAHERSLRKALNLRPEEDITPEKVAAHYKVSELYVNQEPTLSEGYHPNFTPDFTIDLSLIYGNERTSYNIQFRKSGEIMALHGPNTGAYYEDEDEDESVKTPHFIHPVLGECGGENLPPVKIDEAEIPVSLYMSREQYEHLTADDLDPFVPLIDRLAEFDSLARAALPAQTSYYFQDLWDDENYRARLLSVFPNITEPEDITAKQILNAVRINVIMLSLDLSGSDGAALNIDYKILPEDETFPDYTVFCAKFAPNGDFIGISQES